MVKPFLKSELFEGIVGHNEYLELYNEDMIDKENVVLIAIHNPGSNVHPDSKIEGFVDVLQTHFWDLESKWGDYDVIDDDTGSLIRNFIEKHKDKRFFIHCSAGKSRSAGVGCAVECITQYDGDRLTYGMSNSEVKYHERYYPNLKVFDTVLGDDDG